VTGAPRFVPGPDTELTPRPWKQLFAANPLRSDINEFPV